jgi:hypothetical protein
MIALGSTPVTEPPTSTECWKKKRPNGLDPYAGTFEQERFNSTNSNWRLGVAWDGWLLHGNGKIRCVWMSKAVKIGVGQTAKQPTG